MWRAVIIGTIVLAAQLLLTACATNGEGWKSRQTHASLPAHFVQVEDIYAHCPRITGRDTYGCAHRDFVGVVCVIYHRREVALWQLAHEALHCAGVDHES